MDQEGASYLTSDSSFNVPIILSTDGLESFANSSITGTDDDPLNEEVNEIQALRNDIHQSLEESDLHDSMNLDVPQTENPVESLEQENKSDQIQNLKVN